MIDINFIKFRILEAFLTRKKISKLTCQRQTRWQVQGKVNRDWGLWDSSVEVEDEGNL